MNQKIVGMEIRIHMLRWLRVFTETTYNYNDPSDELINSIHRQQPVNENAPWSEFQEWKSRVEGSNWCHQTFAIFRYWTKYFRKFYVKLLENYIDPSFNTISGCHFHNKSGSLDLENSHIHIRFIPQRNKAGEYKNKSSLRKALFDNTPSDTLNRRNYAIIEHTIEDHDRWFRYPLKERYPTPIKWIFRIIPPFTLQKQMLLAHTEWQLASDHEKNKILNAKSTSLYTKIQIKLDSKYYDISKNLIHKPTYKDIYIDILDYYLINNKAITPNNIKGYTYLYLLKHSIITKQEFYMRMHTT